jgi:nitrogen-specific signal transduction histidine kinase
MTETLVQGDWDPARVLPALGKIGYEPHSAILDIVDNSISFDASLVTINLTTEQEQRQGPGRRRTLVTSIDITDNACGMSKSVFTMPCV